MSDLTSGEQAALERVMAGFREFSIAHFRVEVEAHDAAGSLDAFIGALEAPLDDDDPEAEAELAEWIDELRGLSTVFRQLTGERNL